MKQIKQGNFILITNPTHSKYLQIGEVVKVKYYPHSDDVELYIVRFADGMREYKYTLEDDCKVLMFKER